MMGQPDPVSPTSVHRDGAGWYDELLTDEIDFRARSGLRVSRSELTQEMLRHGLSKTEAEAVVRDYCRSRGILPQYNTQLAFVSGFVSALGFGSFLLLMRGALNAMRHTVSRHTWDISRLRVAEAMTVLCVTVGALLALGVIKLILDHTARRGGGLTPDRSGDR